MAADTLNSASLDHPLVLYGAFALCSATLLLFLAWQVAIEGRHHSSRAFGAFCISVAAWALADALALAGPNEDWSRFWIENVRGTAICITVVTWIWFCTAYTLPPGSTWGRLLIACYLLMGIVFVVILWSPWSETWIYTYTLEKQKILWYPVRRESGDLVALHQAFVLSACGLGVSLLVLFLFRAGPDSRWQVLLVLLGTGVTATVSTLSLLGYFGSQALDKVLYTIPIMVLLLRVACFRFGFLKSSPILLRALMTTIPYPIIVLDKFKHLVEANLAGLQLLSEESTHPGQPIKLPCLDLRGMLDSRSELAHFLFTDFVGVRSFKLSTTHPRIMNGERIPLVYGDGKGGDVLVILRDETEHQQLVEDLEQYARFVAHELKNPLTSIVALTDVLQRQREEEHRITAEILAGAERMKDIIHELLLASIPRPGMQELGAVDVRGLTETIVNRLRHETPDVELLIEPPGPWPFVLARGTWVEQILSNLIQNAVEHGGHGPVRVTARVETDKLRVSVVDNGSGSLFQSTQYSSSPESSSYKRKPWPKSINLYPRGLGLTVVRHLVDRLGGETGIESPRGQATTSWFTLPIAKSSSD